MENKVKVKNWNAYMQTTMYTNILLSIRSANDFLFHSSIIFPRANLHGRRILQIHWVASTLRNGFDLQPLKMSSANNKKILMICVVENVYTCELATIWKYIITPACMKMYTLLLYIFIIQFLALHNWNLLLIYFMDASIIEMASKYGLLFNRFLLHQSRNENYIQINWFPNNF